MEIDYAIARQRMVDCQVRTTDVTSHELIDSLLSVAREDFVPADMKALAYIDTDIELGADGRFLVQASPMAKLLQAADILSSDNVLEIGSGSGYVSAVISNYAAKVTALESNAELADTAKAVLAAGGYDNVSVVTGALSAGHKASGPYDAIFINGSIEIEPESLFDQLAEDGRMVAVVGRGGAAQAYVFTKDSGKVSSRKLFNLSIPSIPGFERTAEFQF
jgi:protein-L-isoaspartate(D-aspartate) O-methyltransferase